jgi:hypothetical protein
MAAAGITQDVLLASGIGRAALDAHIAFLPELRGGYEVDVVGL